REPSDCGIAARVDDRRRIVATKGTQGDRVGLQRGYRKCKLHSARMPDVEHRASVMHCAYVAAKWLRLIGPHPNRRRKYWCLRRNIRPTANSMIGSST